MSSLGDLLMSIHIIKSDYVEHKASKRTACSSENVLKSLEKNASKPCSACGHPERHRAKSGRIYTTLCSECYLKRNRIAKQRGK